MQENTENIVAALCWISNMRQHQGYKSRDSSLETPTRSNLVTMTREERGERRVAEHQIFSLIVVPCRLTGRLLIYSASLKIGQPAEEVQP